MLGFFLDAELDPGVGTFRTVICNSYTSLWSPFKVFRQDTVEIIARIGMNQKADDLQTVLPS